MDHSKLYPCIAIAARGRIGKMWIHKVYGKFKMVTKYYYPENPRTPVQQGNRMALYDAVYNWRHFDDGVKNYYNEMTSPKAYDGYRRYISLYLQANPNVIIYWDTLEKNAADSSTVAEYVTSDYIPLVRKDASQTLTEKTLVYPAITTGFSGTGKATGAEITGGTQDAKIVTPKAIADADVNTRLVSKVLLKSFDLSTASGDVAYTGVGFKPSTIIAMVALPGNILSCFGFSDDNDADYCVFTTYAGASFNADGGFMRISQAAGAYQVATVKSYDDDGFTLTWAKTGLPVGTISIILLCFK